MSYSKKAEPTIKRLMANFPSLFPRRQQALNTLLFSIGTGYWWRQGCLVNPNDSPAGKARDERYAREREQAVTEWLKKHPGTREVAAKSPLPKREIPDRWDVPWRLSPISHIPVDVDPTWRAVCIEACEAFLTTPEKSFEDSSEVVEARKQVAEILATLKGE